MNKLRFLTIISIGLVLSNLMLIAFVIMHKPPGPEGRHEPKRFISEKLHFDKDQLKKYEILIADHRMKILHQEMQIREVRKNLFENISNGNDSIKSVLVDSLGKLQKQTEFIHYDHFVAIKALCKEEQLKDYNDLLPELAGLFGKPNPGRRP
ncbi:MAG: hypothetical protein H6605_00360 [Flavobacteriales bacterium]|nr:hypothetical protein [Flavobacteriales bacterium]